MAKRDIVNTATLIRGRTYTKRINPTESMRFEAGVPAVIEDDDLLLELEEEFEEVGDGEGEMLEKPRFRIDRNVEDPRVGKKGPTRLAATRSVKLGKKPRRRRIA